MSCETCIHVVRASEDAKVSRWLQERGLGFCRAYSKRLRKKFLITLVNAAGPVCGGRYFESNGSLI